MKTIAFLCFLLLTGFNSQAQEWQTYTLKDGILIQYRSQELNDPQSAIHHTRIVFRYENTTASNITLNFQRTVTYSDSSNTVPQEKGYTVTIPANSSIEYNPTNERDKTFYIFAQDQGNLIQRTLINFEITNLTIN